MKKPYKIALIIVGTLVAIFLALVLFLTWILDPNDYKQEIITAVKQQTGRDLAIRGDIGLSFFPWIGVELGELELSNARGFGKKPFAKLESAGIKVALLPLFKKSVVIDKVFLDGLELNLSVNRRGISNWDDLAAQGKPASKADKPSTASKGSNDSAVLGMFSVGDLAIRDATIRYDDRQAGNRYALKALTLKSSQFAAGSTATLRLKTTVETTAPKMQLPLSLKADITPDWDKQILTVSPFELEFAKTKIRGKFGMRNFAKPSYDVELAIDDLDLDRLLGTDTGASDTENKSSAKGKASASKAESSGNPLAALATLQAKGKLTIDKLKVSGLRVSKINLGIRARNGTIRLSPVEADLYQGKLTGKIDVNVRGRQPQLHVVNKLKGVEIGRLLSDADIFTKLNGTGDIAVDVTSIGLVGPKLTKNLNGTIGFQFHKGELSGIDLGKLEQQANAVSQLARGKPIKATQDKEDTTAYESISGTMQFTKGVGHNQDFVMQQSPKRRVKGEGWVDLKTETLKYDVVMQRLDKAGKVKGTTIPVRVKGPLANPKYEIRFSKMADEAAKKEIKKKTDEYLKKGLERLLNR